MSRLLTALCLLLVMPLAHAAPREAVVAQAEVQPGKDLNAVLAASGWTVLQLPSSLHQPGKLFKPGRRRQRAAAWTPRR